jgi:hypothetical protein
VVTTIKTYAEAEDLVAEQMKNYSPWLYSEIAVTVSEYRDIATSAENAVAMSLVAAAYRNYRRS